MIHKIGRTKTLNSEKISIKMNVQSLSGSNVCLNTIWENDLWDFYSSNWGQKSKTRVSYWWSCISLFVYVFSVKTSTHSPTIHSSTYRHSPTYNLQHENSFCLASDPQRKMSVSHASWFEKDRILTSQCSARSSSCTFHPEATGAGGKVQSKKLYRLKCKLLH